MAGMRIFAPGCRGVAHMPRMCSSRVVALYVRSVRIRLLIMTGVRIRGRCVPGMRGVLPSRWPGGRWIVFGMVAALRAARTRQYRNGADENGCPDLHDEPPQCRCGVCCAPPCPP
jgi:hypothetical protein